MLYNKNVKTGWYTVENKNKCINDKKSLYYRSGLELKFMKICDFSNNILEWSYETKVLKYQDYRNIGTNKMNRYIMDFYIKKKFNDGTTKKYLIEIKPSDFLTPPKPQKRRTKKYIELIENYARNKSKWAYADAWCKRNNHEFAILTEKDLQ